VFVFLGIKGVWNGIGKAKYDVEFLLFTFLFEHFDIGMTDFVEMLSCRSSSV